MSAAVGRHCMVELWGCAPGVIDDPGRVRKAMLDAVAASGCTLLDECAHRFSPQGVTIVGLLAESHISVHTWPEHGYVAGDVFTCGAAPDPEAACMALVVALGAARYELRTIARGAPGGLQRELPGSPA